MQDQDLPNFFIAGAPKCGTTSLAAWLAENDRIYMHDPKEPHSFDPDYAYPDKISMEEYRTNFRNNCEKPLRGEASTWYLRSESTIKKIQTHCPSAKFIVCIRNPVDMAISLHNQFLQHGLENIKDFHEAWLASNDRLHGRRQPPSHPNPEYLDYRRSCALGDMSNNLLKHVPIENVLFVRLDDIAKNPEQTFSNVCQFLGVPDHPKPEFKAQNEAIERRSLIMFRIIKPLLDVSERYLPTVLFKWVAYAAWKLNTKKKEKTVVSDKVRAEVGKYFASDVALLENVSGLDLSPWKLNDE